uniref:Uncharacterized protein n=1 Tax=Micrurus surinamensis TaxID=129470 RepID=A0A2D4PPE5_MICSU
MTHGLTKTHCISLTLLLLIYTMQGPIYLFLLDCQPEKKSFSIPYICNQKRKEQRKQAFYLFGQYIRDMCCAVWDTVFAGHLYQKEKKKILFTHGLLYKNAG